MSQVSRPFGLAIAESKTSGIVPLASGIRTGLIPSGYNQSLYYGQPVRRDLNGNIIPIQNTTDDWIGVFDGVIYTPAGGRPVYALSWPANTVLQSGTSTDVAYTDAGDLVYYCQFDGSVGADVVGETANFTNITANDSQGRSQCTLGVATRGTGVGQFRVTGLAPLPNNNWGDPFVIVQGQIGRSQYFGDKAGV